MRLTTCNTLQETLHKHKKGNKDQSDPHDVAEGTTNGLHLSESMTHSESKIPNSQKSLLKNWPLVSAIIVYCVFQLHDMTYLEVFLLFLVKIMLIRTWYAILIITFQIMYEKSCSHTLELCCSEKLPQPCRIFQKYATFGGSDTYLSTFLKSSNGIAFEAENICFYLSLIMQW